MKPVSRWPSLAARLTERPAVRLEKVDGKTRVVDDEPSREDE